MTGVCLNDFGTLSMVSHQTRIFIRIAQNQTFRIDNGDSGVGEFAQFLANFINGRYIQFGPPSPKLLLDKPCPRFKSLGYLIDVNFTYFIRCIKSGQKQGYDDYYKVVRINFPE